MLIPPVILKEFRTLVRSRAAFWFLFALLALTGAYFAALWHDLAGGHSISERAALSRILFMKLAAAQFCALGLIAPVMAASVVTVERENRTLDLLLCTGVTRFNILLSKWASTVAYQILLVVCMLPILSLTLQLGGVGLDEYVAAGAAVFQAVLVYGMIGLACSCWFRRSASASMAALFLVLALVLLPPLGYFIFGPGSYMRGPNWGNPSISLTGQLLLALSPATAFRALPVYGLPRNVGSLWDDTTVQLHLIIQAFLFFASGYLAWKGIGRKESERSATAKPIIDDPALLERRRSTWPYYLIDPLKRAQRIRDGQNPVYVKEQRVGLMSRPHVLARLSYIGLFVSVALAFVALVGDTFESMAIVAQVALAMAFLMGPIIAAPSISREREEKTLDLLRATPLSSFGIIMGKYLIALRFMAVMAGSALILPIIAHIGGGFLLAGRLLDGRFNLLDLPKVFPPMVAFIALYAAVGIYFSAACRKNVMAMVLTYAAYAVMSIGFAVFAFIAMEYVEYGYRYGGRENYDPFFSPLASLIRNVISPALSPYALFNLGDGSYRYRRHYGEMATNPASHWIVILIHFVATIALAYFILKRATRRLEKSFEQ